MLNWWDSPDADSQADVLAKFEPLAKANPKNDLLVAAALAMAGNQAATDALADSLRDIVDHDLNGPAALKYERQPYKLGRPFKLTINALGGKEVSTTDWKGKVVLIDFWATWCPPCMAALPNLVRIYDADHAKGLEILGISNDSVLPDLKNFLASHKEMAWPESFNPTGADHWNALSSQMGVTAIPTTALIDRNGLLRDIEVSEIDEDLLNKLLNEEVKPELAAAPSGKSDAATQQAISSKPAAIDSGEKQANAMLSVANSYIAINRADRAREKLNQLLANFPNSTAAPKAKELLAQLNAQN
jgi:thiol-disulfide isomerase/thioredoxin